MKTLFLSILTFITINVTAQSVTAELKEALTTDKPELLFKTVDPSALDNCYQVNNKPYHLLSLAIKTKAQKCFSALIKKGANLESDCSAKTPLLYAVKYGELNMLKELVENGANYKAKKRGRSAIDYAIHYEQKEILAYLSTHLEK
ncbi:ankyrin repeat domain-containing protein [Aquimarina brevivitae]|uniref:Ankyrin repeat protein n=1 Tax=Aquimarina brevivitae TaxID=323412 RepID=A0A4Q7PHD8_9FLAO|nr:ankyrin repeat domain-containing protein [Aquimarina brevivitae]RZS99567.1 ankyrin repeat protein [Aquimarina brevivitae]